MVVFNGLNYLRKERPFVSEDTRPLKRNAAWEAYYQGNKDAAAQLWLPAGSVSPADYMIQAVYILKDLHVEFMTRVGVVKAVNGITFALDRGKVLTILGESGSGKSVTLRSLVRLLPKVRTRLSGEVVLKGMNLYELSEGEVQNLRGSLVAMIFQEPMTALDTVYTVGDQIV